MSLDRVLGLGCFACAVLLGIAYVALKQALGELFGLGPVGAGVLVVMVIVLQIVSGTRLMRASRRPGA